MSKDLQHAQRLYHVVDTTWPAAQYDTCGPFTLRRGDGGGQRVSSASLHGATFNAADIEAAETAMLAMGQPLLFMIREGDTALDAALGERDYFRHDPVTVFTIDAARLAEHDPQGLVAIDAPEPLPIMANIWAQGGIGEGRLNVMRRAPFPKACFLGRSDNAAAGAVFAGCDGEIAMLHALDVLPEHRRKRLALQMMGAVGAWAVRNGAKTLALVVLTDNDAACGLYRRLGMEEAGRYHYRKKELT